MRRMTTIFWCVLVALGSAALAWYYYAGLSSLFFLFSFADGAGADLPMGLVYMYSFAIVAPLLGAICAVIAAVRHSFLRYSSAFGLLGFVSGLLLLINFSALEQAVTGAERAQENSFVFQRSLFLVPAGISLASAVISALFYYWDKIANRDAAIDPIGDVA